MVDLHTHILPAMDDGSSSVEESLALLEDLKNQGVTKVYLTPHFYPDRERIESFIGRRQRAFEKIRGRVKGIDLRLGAEVRFSQALTGMDLEPLVLEGSDYILIELSSQWMPYRLGEVFFDIQSMGYAPIIPHPERSDYFRQDPAMLQKLLERGILCQVNAEHVLDKIYKSFVHTALKKNYYHFLASDTHSMDQRPPYLEKAYQALDRIIGPERRKMMADNALMVWHNEGIESAQPLLMKKILNRYY